MYESGTEDFIRPPFQDRPSSRVAERRRQHFASFDSGSTWVGDREEEDRFTQNKLETPRKGVFASSLSPKTFLSENDEDEDDLKR